MVLDSSCWFLVIFGSSQCFLMVFVCSFVIRDSFWLVLGGSLWFLVVLGGSFGFSVVHGIS